MTMNPNGSSWHSYPKIFALGHPTIADLFKDPVLVEEKVDGSQFSFGVFDGDIRCKSKGKELVLDACERMFELAVETVKRLAPELMPGWTYRGEFLQKPHHNGLSYDRVPAGHIILFDVNDGEERYLSRSDKEREAARLGLEIVPVVFNGVLSSPEQMAEQMDRVSILGGCKIEGLVFKNYVRFGPDKKALMGKYVREDFKEIQGKAWKIANPKSGDIVQQLGEKVKTEARWEKGVQHLRERGELLSSPADIGNLMKEVQRDIEDEFAEQAKEILWAHAKKQILRMAVSGLPEWYKAKLVAQQFTPEQAALHMGLKIAEKSEHLANAATKREPEQAE